MKSPQADIVRSRGTGGSVLVLRAGAPAASLASQESCGERTPTDHSVQSAHGLTQTIHIEDIDLVPPLLRGER